MVSTVPRTAMVSNTRLSVVIIREVSVVTPPTLSERTLVQLSKGPPSWLYDFR